MQVENRPALRSDLTTTKVRNALVCTIFHSAWARIELSFRFVRAYTRSAFVPSAYFLPFSFVFFSFFPREPSGLSFLPGDIEVMSK